jgi:26S proteasome regulatory subunit N12
LRLLAANDIAGFHTMLEELAATTSELALLSYGIPQPADHACMTRLVDIAAGFDQLMNDKYTKFPLDLERWLMEGSYSKVWSARASSPLPENQIFLDQLIQTVRNEIASCGERAYTSLPLHDAAVLLFFQNREELLQFASQRKGWSVNPTAEVITFEGTIGDERDEANKAELPKERVVDTILGYARELETIV